jgi:hypothetical protein
MLEPKNTSVALAGQKASHIRVGEATPRLSGKYFPSQLRTQKLGPELMLGPELSSTGGAGDGGCRLVLKTLSKNELWGFCFWLPPKKKSSRPSAELISGARATGRLMAVATEMWCSLR